MSGAEGGGTQTYLKEQEALEQVCRSRALHFEAPVGVRRSTFSLRTEVTARPRVPAQVHQSPTGRRRRLDQVVGAIPGQKSRALPIACRVASEALP